MAEGDPPPHWKVRGGTVELRTGGGIREVYAATIRSRHQASRRALDENPALNLEIDGYTDSVGDADHNLYLSKRRAQAAHAVLVSQFGEDASRLSSNGMGAGKPIASNDTAEGRAENRRVEFPKQ